MELGPKKSKCDPLHSCSIFESLMRFFYLFTKFGFDNLHLLLECSYELVVRGFEVFEDSIAKISPP